MKKELWLRLRGYRFEHLVPAHLADRLAAAFGGSDVSTRAFASKVARKHDWTTTYALRVIAEYKKFVYLGVVSDFPVTPPKAIDAVWHEHILFSAAYRDFCHEVLGRPFDHNPELVPDPEQSAAFHEQYAATLALYRTEFRASPPHDVWGTPKFDLRAVGALPDTPRRADAGTHALAGSGDGPLHTYFEGSSGDDAGGDFGGGGGFSGGGGGESWGSDAPADTGSDGASSDGGGCSSGCGGGGE